MMRFNPRPHLSNKAVLALLLTLVAGPASAHVNHVHGDTDPPFGDVTLPPGATPSEQDGVASSPAGSYAIDAQGDRVDEGAGSGEPTAATADAPVATPHTVRSPTTQQETSGVNRYADEMGLP